MALIGSILVLILPFSYSSFENPISNGTSTLALFWYNVQGEILFFSGEETGSFTIEWLEEGGRYEAWFGSVISGILILALLGVAIFMSITADSRNNKSIPAVLLIVVGVLITFFRLSQLSESDYSFYTSNETALGESTYFEIPLALLYSLIFGILDLRAD